MPKAINTVVVRILVFYVGSVLLLSAAAALLRLPGRGQPVRDVLRLHRLSTGADAIMNMVVLTAALSSLNAGLYSTGRILHSMSMAGSAPKFAGRMNKAGVPYGGIALTARGHAAGRRPERGGSRRGLRDRAQRGLPGHSRRAGPRSCCAS